MPRILTIGLAAAVTFVVGQQVYGRMNPQSLQTGPLIEQAVRIYREGGGGERMTGIREQLDALRPANVGYAEIHACTESGYMLRRVETARVAVDYLDNPSVQGMGEVARLVYLEHMPQGVQDGVNRIDGTWPSHYDCQKQEGATGWHVQDDRENGYAFGARAKMAKAWRAELEREGPEAFKVAEERAEETLAVNHVIDDPEAAHRAESKSVFARR